MLWGEIFRDRPSRVVEAAKAEPVSKPRRDGFLRVNAWSAVRLGGHKTAELALKPELISGHGGLLVRAGVVDQCVVRDHLAGLVASATADVFTVAASDFRELARVADAFGQAEGGAAATGPLTEPASKPCRTVSKMYFYIVQWVI